MCDGTSGSRRLIRWQRRSFCRAIWIVGEIGRENPNSEARNPREIRSPKKKSDRRVIVRPYSARRKWIIAQQRRCCGGIQNRETESATGRRAPGLCRSTFATLNHMQGNTNGTEGSDHADNGKNQQVIRARDGSGQLCGDVQRGMPGVGRSVAGEESDCAGSTEQRG